MSKPTTGMSAPAKGLTIDELNDNERRVLDLIGRHEPVSLVLLSTLAFGIVAPHGFRAKSPSQANSWCRNALRRLVSERFVIACRTKPALYRVRETEQAHE